MDDVRVHPETRAGDPFAHAAERERVGSAAALTRRRSRPWPRRRQGWADP